MSRKIHKMTTWMAIALMVAMAPTAHAEGRLSGMLSGGMNAARSVGGRAMNRASQGAGMARGVASRGAGAALNVANRGTGAAQAVAQRGANVAQGTASRVANTGTQVATRGVNAAGSAVNRARLAEVAIRDRAVNVGTNVATRGVNATGSALNRARLAEIAIRDKAVDVGTNVATRGVNAAGSAANRARLAEIALRTKAQEVGTRGVNAVGSAVNTARLAENAVQARLDNLVPQQAIAVGIDRFANATQIAAVAAPQNIAAPVAGVVPGLINDVPGVVDGALQVGGGLAEGNVGEIADGVVNIVNASQPQIPAEVIPAAVGALGVAGGLVGRGAVGGGSGGGSVASAPMTVASAPVEAEYASQEIVEPTSAYEATADMIGAADLVLEDLQLAARATIVAGPAYVLRFRNQGSAAAHGFHVALLAGINGNVTEDSPRALAYFASVAPGEAIEVMLRLPASAMQIPGADGHPSAMTHLFVALDLADAIVELDEVNNLAIVEADTLRTAMQ